MTYRDTAYLKSHLELNNFFNSDLMCNKILKVRNYCGGGGLIRVSEPEPGASYKNRRLRNPVDILLLELMKAYIF